jgi:hypothetical protein
MTRRHFYLLYSYTPPPQSSDILTSEMDANLRAAGHIRCQSKEDEHLTQ